MKTAFIFPGQGAQYVGMAQDYIAAKPEFAKVLKDFDACLLYTSDAADDLLCVDLGARRIIKKKTQQQNT